MQRHAAALDEDETLADLAQDVEMVALVRVQADEHRPAFGLQAAEKVEHEADVAVLGIELRLVEQVHHRIVAARGLEQEIGFAAPEAPYLVGLVVVDREAVALARLDAVDVLPHAHDAPRGGRVGAGYQFEQRRLPRAVRPEHADDLGLFEREARLQPERGAPTPAVLLHQVLDGEDHSPSNLWRRGASSSSAAAAPACTMRPWSMT